MSGGAPQGRFYADLHIHSKYSRATSKDCDLEHLAYWGLRKGITVVGTGDFTHPAWRAELREKLVPAEPGLFRLRDDIERAVRREPGVAAAPDVPIRFMLSVEISNIYKRHDKTRKIHNLVYAASLDTADRIAERLETIGNIRSDGRPILGLDSRDLLEITLEAGEDAYLVPAHIWTPWFAMFGSKSGFDTVEACFGDLTRHIFAIETGLSSDPAMNWRLSQLDRYRLVSNSDAHSPPKLGREANAFTTALDYFAMRRALETGEGFAGTVEFFPEEGKYHLDGHRKCEVRLTPEETRALEGRCPVCGKPLTVGTMSRVSELADRPDGFELAEGDPYRSFVPLPEVISEIVGAGPGSKRVAKDYERLLSAVGPELYILERAPVEDVRKASSEIVAEAIRRMRSGEVIREAGFDGEYGVVRMFTREELARRTCVDMLFGVEWTMPQLKPETPRAGASGQAAAESGPAPEPAPVRASAPAVATPALAPELRVEDVSRGMLGGLDPDQAAAARVTEGSLLIVAGPGTGKTRTLTRRIAHLIRDCGAAAESCLAITFTRRAAEELRERLASLLLAGSAAAGSLPVRVHTFHGLCLELLREALREDGQGDGARRLLGLTPAFRVAHEWEQLAAIMEGMNLEAGPARRLLRGISRLKRTRARAEPGSELEQARAAYERHMRAQDWVDCDDLVALATQLLAADEELRARLQRRYRYVSVDEYQDVDELQYRLIRQLAPPGSNLCVIGDPDQAIYGFRGADVGFFLRFRDDYPGAREVQLTRNYRSGRCIVDASMQVIARASLVAGRVLSSQQDHERRLVVHEAPSAAAEAEFVVHTIERLIGGYSFFSVDSGRVSSGAASTYGFSDFAILYRSSAQLAPLEEALTRSGIPYQRRSHNRLGDRPGVQELVLALTRAPTPTGGRDGLCALAALEAIAADEPAHEPTLELLRPLASRCATVDDLLTEIAMGAECEVWDPRAARVSLLTLHASKGLEFPVVFLVGCEDGVVPLRFGGDRSGDDEERRLFFVGMTRAEQRLLLTRATKRLWRGAVREQSASPFTRDIDEGMVERPELAPRPKRVENPQLTLF